MDSSNEAEELMASEVGEPGNSRQPAEESNNIIVEDDDEFCADLRVFGHVMTDLVDELDSLRDQYEISPYMSELKPRLSYEQTRVYLKAAKTADDITRATRNMKSSTDLPEPRKFILLGRLVLLLNEIQGSVDGITEEVARCKEVDELLSGKTFEDSIAIMAAEIDRAKNVGKATNAKIVEKPRLASFLLAPLLDLLEADQQCLEALEAAVDEAVENGQSTSPSAKVTRRANFKKSLWTLMVATRTVDQRLRDAISKQH